VSRAAANKARFVPAPVRLAELGLVDRADLEQELELGAQVGAHHLRAVGGDRKRHPVLGEGAEGVADGVLVAERMVNRFEVGQISGTISASSIWAISLASRACWTSGRSSRGTAVRFGARAGDVDADDPARRLITLASRPPCSRPPSPGSDG
jgi:hypothetical protein